MTTQEDAIKKTFDKRFTTPLDFDFFKHPVYPGGLKEVLIVRLELTSSEKVILCTGDTSATFKLSEILPEFDTTFGDLAITGAIKGSSTEKLYHKLGTEYLRLRRWFRKLCLSYKNN